MGKRTHPPFREGIVKDQTCYNFLILKGEFMNKLILLALTLSLVSCASKWKPKSSNPVASQENTLKTEWGQIKVDYDKTTDEGIFFNIELKNDSKSPVTYQRGYITLQSNKGDK